MRRLLVASLLLTACARVQSRPEPFIMQQGATARPMRGRVTDHVIVISVDGLRPDAIAKYGATTMQRLMREGRYSLTAQTITNSKTLPSHTSMLTGVDADVHGVHWNSDKTGQFGYVKVPTVFGLAHDAGFATAAVFSKTKFHHLAAPKTIDFVKSPGKFAPLSWQSERTADYATEFLRDATPNLMFIHIAEADFAAHRFGWMSKPYGLAVREADMAIGRIIAEADARFGRGAYTVIVTADHGGHGKGHGTTHPLDMTIPWIVWGSGVQPGAPLTGIRTMDTAASALWMLGINAPESWTGKPVTSAFTSTTAANQ
jgi:predicted AlkP superfamily pyrophosphatase or phosphodiesterase